MQRCPYCGRWFKNRYAVISHLKHCPLRGAKPSERTEMTLKIRGYRFNLLATERAKRILLKLAEELRGKEKGEYVLYGAITALKMIGEVAEHPTLSMAVKVQ